MAPAVSAQQTQEDKMAARVARKPTAPTMTVVDATYRRINPSDDWYEVLIRDTKVGETFKTRRGYLGFCLNAPKSPLGPKKKKEELGQLIVAKWEAFPVPA